jgi:hypothetical protein
MDNDLEKLPYFKDLSKPTKFQHKSVKKEVEHKFLTTEEKYERYKKMSVESIRTANDQRRKIQKIEKRKAERRSVIIQIAIGILVSAILIAAVDKKPHKFGHNGEILDTDDSYSDMRGR